MKAALQKVVLITNIPNPYRVALFNELNIQLEQLNISLHVIFGAETYSRRNHRLNPENFRFAYSVLKSKKVHFGNKEQTYFNYSGLNAELKKLKADAVIVSGFSLAAFLLFWKSLFGPVPYIIWTGSVLTKGRNDSLIRKWYRQLLLSRCRACVVYGSKARDYLRSLGVQDSKIFTAINTVDTTFFHKETSNLRGELNLLPPYHLCTVGYFTPRKKMMDLLKTIYELSTMRQDFILDIIGDGPELPAMKKYVEERKMQSLVLFHGFRQQEELPAYLANSLCFLFQTGFDIWGLVVNEAMAAGLPCLASVHAAATHDLIEHGKTGFAVDFSQHRQTALIISELLDHPEHARQTGNQAAEFIRQFASVKSSANGFVSALQFIHRKK